MNSVELAYAGRISSGPKRLAEGWVDESMADWEQIQGSAIISEIKRFAEEIMGRGQEYDLDSLANWGEDLSKQANSFDRDQLPETRGHFPSLVDEIAGLTP